MRLPVHNLLFPLCPALFTFTIGWLINPKFQITAQSVLTTGCVHVGTTTSYDAFYTIALHGWAFLTGGTTRSWSAGSADGLLVYWNPQGTPYWIRGVGTNAPNEEIRAILRDPDGNYLLIMETGNTGVVGDLGDVWLIRIALSTSGPTILWAYRYKLGNQRDIPFSGTLSHDGDYIIIGGTYSLGAGQRDIFAMEINRNTGNLEWLRTYGAAGEDMGTEIRKTATGYVLVGTSLSYGNSGQILLIHIGLTGALQWARLIGNAGYESALDIEVLSDGSYLIIGGTESYQPYGNREAYALRISHNGNTILWGRVYGGTQWDEFHTVIQASNGDILMLGKSQSNWLSGYSEDFYLVRANPTTGNPIQSQFYDVYLAGTYSTDEPYGANALVEAPASSGFFFVGLTNDGGTSIPPRNAVYIRTNTNLTDCYCAWGTLTQSTPWTPTLTTVFPISISYNFVYRSTLSPILTVGNTYGSQCTTLPLITLKITNVHQNAPNLWNIHYHAELMEPTTGILLLESSPDGTTWLPIDTLPTTTYNTQWQGPLPPTTNFLRLHYATSTQHWYSTAIALVQAPASTTPLTLTTDYTARRLHLNWQQPCTGKLLIASLTGNILHTIQVQGTYHQIEWTAPPGTYLITGILCNQPVYIPFSIPY